MRSDVKNLAKCGKESAYWCKRHKENCSHRYSEPKCPFKPKDIVHTTAERMAEMEIDYNWDLKEWPVQTHLRAKTMEEHLEQIRTLFGNKLSPWIKITLETDFEADTEYAWCKKGHKPMCGDIELHFEGGYEFTHYRPIPPIPEN